LQILIEPINQTVRVHLAGHILAETQSALRVWEGGHDAGLYIPRADIDLTMLERSSNQAFFPQKGQCTYFNLPDAETRSQNAAWSFENPQLALATVKD